MFLSIARAPFVVLFASTLLATVPIKGQTQNHPIDGYEWMRAPVKGEVESADASQQSRIIARGQIFDRLGSPVPLDKPGFSSGISAGGEVQDEFPASSADAVVIATFVTSRPHLTPSRRSIYTEITMRCDSVAFSKAQPLAAGQEFTVLILGGSLIPPGERKPLTYGIERTPYAISPGQTYLLFLHYNATGDFYEIHKFWLIENHILVPSSTFDERRASRNQSLHAGMDADKAIEEAKAAVKR